MTITLSHYLVLAAALFVIGLVGVFIRRNAITILMCIELMLNAVNLTFIAFASHMNAVDGLIFVFFVITVAAAEVAVGLAIVIALFRNRDTVNLDELNLMRW
ncbi:MAG: NADH-quinone oxidoreductase subunit NuoK [Deltaproteobacteria bacterium]|nr:NADH-quinone oxidoreductase subunit NuoK [Deltaproteobacteria bacterium]MBI3077266.1 NADH-quinone oxidoreductase subunit NuoK [Deltaproteobacteria bacterium]